MKLILEIGAQDDDRVMHLALDKFPATIGRGFDNDVILTDPHIHPRHLRIDYDGDTCTVSDLSTESGVIISKETGKAGKTRKKSPVKSGDTLRLGQTKIRVYTPEHPVAPTLPIQKTHPVFYWLSRSPNVWACAALALSMTLGWSFLETWTDEPGVVIAGAAAVTVGTVILWAAAWSVAGRLIRHKAHFKSHTAMICLYMVAGVVAWYIEAYTDFLTNENWFSLIMSYGLNSILLGFLLYGSLTLATRMVRQRRLTSAVFFALGVMGGIFVFSVVSAKNFSQQPLYTATLQPYLSQLAPADTIGEFMAGNEKLFASDEFSPDKK